MRRQKKEEKGDESPKSEQSKTSRGIASVLGIAKSVRSTPQSKKRAEADTLRESCRTGGSAKRMKRILGLATASVVVVGAVAALAFSATATIGVGGVGATIDCSCSASLGSRTRLGSWPKAPRGASPDCTQPANRHASHQHGLFAGLRPVIGVLV